MSNIAQVQAVLMFNDSLPMSMDYESLVKQCFRDFVEPIATWNGNNLINGIPFFAAEGPKSKIVIQNERISIERTKIDDLASELDDMVLSLDKISDKIGVDYGFKYRLGLVVTIQEASDKIKIHASNSLHESKLNSPEFNVSFLEKSNEGNVKVNKWEVINYDVNQEYSVLIIDANSDMNNEFYLGKTRPSDVYNNLKGVLMNAYKRFENIIS